MTFFYYRPSRTSAPLVKVNLHLYETLSLTASTLLHRLVLLIVCFINPMSVRYSTNWDRKGWPGSEIKMYYGWPCTMYICITRLLGRLNLFFVQLTMYDFPDFFFLVNLKIDEKLNYFRQFFMEVLLN